MSSRAETLVCSNRKLQARLDVEERLEAGLVLTGSEVKALRAGRASLEGAFVRVDGADLWLHGMHVGPFEHAGAFAHEPRRVRKLLVKHRQREWLRGRLSGGGMVLVPLRLYFRGPWAKVELALGRVRKQADRREQIRAELDRREARAVVARRR
ncbi:MAG: SsrA-binding protein SmpB [Myxococcota bacterium]|nr:SsrA-binding protein SmpB [Myxococcota bacterium]MDW8361114.1 SsrA-binding protein SmpB [Myxococcales bacterium]